MDSRVGLYFDPCLRLGRFVFGLKSTLIYRYSYCFHLGPGKTYVMLPVLNIYPCYSFRFVWVTSEGLDSSEPTYARGIGFVS